MFMVGDERGYVKMETQKKSSPHLFRDFFKASTSQPQVDLTEDKHLVWLKHTTFSWSPHSLNSHNISRCTSLGCWRLKAKGAHSLASLVRKVYFSKGTGLPFPSLLDTVPLFQVQPGISACTEDAKCTHTEYKCTQQHKGKSKVFTVSLIVII